MDLSSNGQDPPPMILSLEDTVKLVGQVTQDLSQGSYSSLQPSIVCLSSNLKLHGPSLEPHHGELLDRLQLVLRPACRDHKLDLKSRILLLEILELRTFNWEPSQQVSNYYKTKLKQINSEMLSGDHHSPSAQGFSEPPSSHHDFSSAQGFSKLPSSHHDFSSSQGIFRQSRANVNSPNFRLGTSHLLMNFPHRPTGPTRIRNFPNTPTGPTRIRNFPNPPTAPNHFRNFPIPPTVPNHLNILPEPTTNLPRKFPNSPTTPNVLYPDRSPLSNLQQPPAKCQSKNNLKANPQNTSNSDDHSMGETEDKSEKKSFNVYAKGGDLVLSSVNVDLLHTLKQILQEELSDEILHKSGSSSSSSLGSSKPELVYQKPELLELATSPLCKLPPKDWDNILKEIPAIVKSTKKILKKVSNTVNSNPVN